MRNKGLTQLLAMAICLIQLAAMAVSHAAEPTLKIGDQAPTIEPITWLQGSPVTKYEAGHVYVVEFWATWCPPCVAAPRSRFEASPPG